MPKMTKPDAKKWPELKQAWDDYGHAIPWEQLIDIKSQHYMEVTGSYVALAWRVGDEIEYADLERVGGVWEMNNDGGEPVSEEAWLAARCKPECNWLEFPEEV